MATMAIVIDPRNPQLAVEAITTAKGTYGLRVVGFEVTHPAVVKSLDKNFNRQHEGNANVSAVAEAMEAAPSGCEFQPVFFKTDIDAIAAYCVHAGFEDLDGDRLDMIHRYDTFADGPAASVDEAYERMRPLGAVLLAMMDFRVHIDVRIQWMVQWLQTGLETGMESFRAQFEDGFAAVRTAITDGTLTSVVEDGVCAMETDLEVGNLLLQVGYTYSSVLVCRKPSTKKVTICQPCLGHTDLNEVKRRLNLEDREGWGGPSGTMCCSPVDGGTEKSLQWVGNIVREVTRAYHQ